jgi:hypothetical protein
MPADPGDTALVIGDGACDSRTVGAVTATLSGGIGGIGITIAEVPPVDVIDMAVAVIIDARRAGSFRRVRPDIGGQVLVVAVDACVNDGEDDAAVPLLDIPGLGCVDVREIMLLGISRIVRHLAEPAHIERLGIFYVGIARQLSGDRDRIQMFRDRHFQNPGDIVSAGVRLKGCVAEHLLDACCGEALQPAVQRRQAGRATGADQALRHSSGGRDAPPGARNAFPASVVLRVSVALGVRKCSSRAAFKRINVRSVRFDAGSVANSSVSEGRIIRSMKVSAIACDCMASPGWWLPEHAPARLSSPSSPSAPRASRLDYQTSGYAFRLSPFASCSLPLNSTFSQTTTHNEAPEERLPQDRGSTNAQSCAAESRRRTIPRTVDTGSDSSSSMLATDRDLRDRTMVHGSTASSLFFPTSTRKRL